MGQAISFIFRRLFGGRKPKENEKPWPNPEDNTPLPSYYIDIIEQHIYEEKKKAEVVTNIHQHHLIGNISGQQQQQQRQQKLVFDPLVKVEKPRPIQESYTPLPGHCIDITEKHNYEEKKKAEVVTNIHQHHLTGNISGQQQQQQRQQKLVFDPLVKVEKLRPSQESYMPLPGHCIDITKKHNYEEKKKAEVATNIHQHHLTGNISGKQQQQQRQQKVIFDPLVKVEKPSLNQESYTPMPSHCIDITEKHNYEEKKKAEVATNILQHHLAGNISGQQQQQQQRQQKLVFDPSVKVEKPRPSQESYTPLPSHYIDITEKYNYEKKKAEVATNIHRHHLAVTTSLQQQQQQQQQKVVSDPLVQVYLHQPLIATNSIVASVAVDKKTKPLIIKAATKEAASTKRSKSKNKKKETLKIGPYVNTQKILLVGEGDFSFSASLAVAFGYAPRIVATSLNSKVFLMKNYKRSMANIENLESRGALVLHDVDATNMANHPSLGRVKFDRVIFNFPHTCYFGRTSYDISQNQELVRGFLRNAKKMVEEDEGEIHVTHKTSAAYAKWNIVQLGLMEEDLYLIGSRPFDPRVFPGYDTKYGHGGDNNFDWFPCKLYKFGLVCQSLN